MQDGVTAADSAPQWDQIVETILCPLCDYNLRGLAEPRCPECGYRFAWGELLRAAREDHPTLFDHHPRKKLRNFFVTLGGGFLAASFWKSISPTLSGSRRRLLLYVLLYMTPCILVVGYTGVTQAMRYEAMAVSDRARMATSLSAPANARWAKAEVAKYGSVQGVVDAYCPPWWRGRGLVVLLRELCIVGGLLLAPAGTLLGMMIFQASMRRARIKQVHVLRCVVYSYDVLLIVGLVALTITVMAVWFRWSIRQPVLLPSVGNLAYNYRPMGATLYEYGLWVVLVVAGWRLGRAYHYYLRFDHPYWMAYSVQLIVALLYAVLIVNRIV